MAEPRTQFYTYLWLREDGTPYYVGKGNGRRGLRSEGHNVHCPRFKARIVIQHWATEEEALQMEKWWISLFGRKDLGTGILRNMTDGGDGQSGLVHSEKTKRRMSESQFRRQSKIARVEKVKEIKPRKLYSEKSKFRMREAQLLSWATKRKGAFRKPRIKKVPTCHPEAKYQGKGLCTVCYLKAYHKATGAVV
jgi:hypothetical protein